ncbi:MAG: type II toxin-antitoxin system HicA family toxin [Thaumarchaeota archaeon]|nr:type II toxin-antitoxin system HicA family toxin [Nitrososphaerota archaeon]
MSQSPHQSKRKWWRSVAGKLPVVSGRELVKALGKIGYSVDHQTGSHVILRNTNAPHRRITVPYHSEIAKYSQSNSE